MYKTLKKLLYFTFIFVLGVLHATQDHSIVFIHVGDSIPPYADVALSQARLFNEKCPIILLASHRAIQEFKTKAQNITFIAYDGLKKSKNHENFIRNSTLDMGFGNEFWRYCSERFLYLDDLMIQYNLKNVFHLEYDNLLYANLEKLLPVFTTYYEGIAATFDNDERCIPGFVFIPTQKDMSKLAKCFTQHDKNDMAVLAIYKNIFGPKAINHLPIICEDYVHQYSLISADGQNTAKEKHLYCQFCDLFQSIFDAAALGQYLGGIDPRINGSYEIGHINAGCVINPSLLSYEWHKDDNGRNVPYAVFNNKRYRINNLHMHSKRLAEFASWSNQPTM